MDRADYQRVHIHEGIDSCLTLIESDLRNRVTVQKDYGDIPEIACYPSQLNQAFINVLKNAAHAIEEKGVIDIRTFLADDHIHVKIADTGRGIPRDRLDNIFDFGFSSDASRVKMRSGLSAVYQIIQRHRGDVQVSSELGKGTTVTMTLPIV